jgi:hypothetical protein
MPYLIVVIIGIEVFSGPTSIMSDTAIIAASLNDGDYGRCRFWACLAWGAAGVASSPLMHWTSDRYTFAAYGAISILAFAAASRLDFSFIGSGQRAHSARDSALDTNEAEAAAQGPRLNIAGGKHSHGGEHKRAMHVRGSESVHLGDMEAPLLAEAAEACYSPRQNDACGAGHMHHLCSTEDTCTALNGKAPCPTGGDDGECMYDSAGRSAGVGSVEDVAVAAIRDDTASSSADALGNVGRGKYDMVLTDVDAPLACSQEEEVLLTYEKAVPVQQSFWHQYASLLRQQRMLVFLAKALVMGVRSSFLFCDGTACQ